LNDGEHEAQATGKGLLIDPPPRLTGISRPEYSTQSRGVLLPGSATRRPLALPPRVPRFAPLREGLAFRRDAVFRRLLAVADLVSATGGLVLIGALTNRGLPVASIATIPMIVPIAKMLGRYDRDEVVLRKSTLDEIPALLTLAGAYTLTWSFVAFLTGVHMDLRGGGLFVLWASIASMLILTRFAARQIAKVLAPLERVLIVGDAGAPERLAHSLASDPGARIELAGLLPFEADPPRNGAGSSQTSDRRQATFDDFEQIARELDIHRVFLVPTDADSETMLEAIRRAVAIGVKVSIVPRLLEAVGSSVEFDSVGGVTVLGLRRSGLTWSSRVVKRITDLLGAVIGLVALAPLGALVAVAIKLESPGPVLFRQHRIGRDGQPFELIKFRSMVNGADAQRAALQSLNESSGLFKLSDDPRITRVGRLLRRSSIDELPQLLNVLRGDMSLVGPRPLVLDEDRLVEGRHRDRLQLAPGMTGPWQVLGPTRPPLSEMVKTDYLYAANWSLWSDIKIILRTFVHATARRGL
jgi:exopolysaccharide biosynthesis polyprenyl glycosylphosphotransferase